MKAMVLNRITNLNSDSLPLTLVDMPVPSVADREILIEVAACGVCHTD